MFPIPVSLNVKSPNASMKVKYCRKLLNIIRINAFFFGFQDILFAGDFNADCSYLSSSKYSNLLFTTDSRFQWLINGDSDTTVSINTNCAYDR